MVAALVDKCREEVVLPRKRTREASIIGFWPLVVEGGGLWRVQAPSFICSVPIVLIRGSTLSDSGSTPSIGTTQGGGSNMPRR